jgi:hypothetical protein
MKLEVEDVAADLKAKIQPFWNTLARDLKEAARRFKQGTFAFGVVDGDVGLH